MKYLLNSHEHLKNNVSKKLKNTISIIAMALVLLVSVNVSAQNKKYTKQEVKDNLSKVMLSLVESAKPFYFKGDSYKTFRYKLYGKQARINPSKKGDVLIKKVYSYLSNGSSAKTIMNGSVSEIADAYLFIYEIEKNTKTANGEIELFGSTTGDFNPGVSKKGKCCFFCLKCHLTTIFGEVGGNTVMNAIIDAIIGLLKS